MRLRVPELVTRPSDKELIERIRRGTGAVGVELGARLQSLWGGYGELFRAELTGLPVTSAVVKCVLPPPERALASDPRKRRSHRRKLRSYEVELAFYQRYASRCADACRVPRLLYGAHDQGQFLFVLEDLDAAGFGARRARCSDAELALCLSWLAAFHARFLGVASEGLWKVGTYWQLATRPDELAALGGHALRRAAPRIDRRLNAASFRTLVHGDAKLENFCFSRAGDAVAAVDFQYVGGGVGVKDVAYFLSSCFSPRECQAAVPPALDLYFAALRSALAVDSPGTDAGAVEREWRELFAWAWLDFYRFLLGWAPLEAARDEYSEALLHALLARGE